MTQRAAPTTRRINSGSRSPTFFADDVKCTHGGGRQLDEDAVFYLRAR